MFEKLIGRTGIGRFPLLPCPSLQGLLISSAAIPHERLSGEDGFKCPDRKYYKLLIILNISDRFSSLVPLVK